MTPMATASSPLISVVMAVYRPDPAYFRAAVESILAQTLQDFELIIVEDPSGRCGRELLAGLRDPRIRHLVNPQRTGLVAQRNRGLAEARAEFVAIQDADDLAESTRLERQYHFLRDHADVGVVGSQVCVIDADGKVQGYRSFPADHEQILHAMSRFLPVSQPATMFRKALVVAAGGYRESGADAVGVEEYDLVSRLALGGARFANLPEALVRYRLHPGQLKATHFRCIVRGTVRVKRRYWRRRMDWAARLRLWAECLLLVLPPGLARPLLIRVLYRNAQPVRPGCAEAPPPGRAAFANGGADVTGR